MDFGAHGVTHRDLTQIEGDLLADEVLRPKAMIEERLARLVTSFAAPFGRSSAAVLDLVRRQLPAGRQRPNWPRPETGRIRTRFPESRCGISGTPGAGRHSCAGTQKLFFWPDGSCAVSAGCRSLTRGGQSQQGARHEFLVASRPTRADHLQELPGRAVAALLHILHQFDLQSEMRALLLLAQLEQQGRPHVRGDRRAVAIAGPDREPQPLRGRAVSPAGVLRHLPAIHPA